MDQKIAGNTNSGRGNLWEAAGRCPLSIHLLRETFAYGQVRACEYGLILLSQGKLLPG